MITSKFKIAGAMAVLSILAAGVGGLLGAAPRLTAPGRLLVWRGEGFLIVTPDGAEGGRLPGRVDDLVLNEPVIAPDGWRVAFTVNDDPPADARGSRRRKVFVRALDGEDPGRMFSVNALHVFWSPDGHGLYAVEAVVAKDSESGVLRCSLIDTATGEKTPVEMPPLVDPFAVTPDGKAFVVAEYDTSVRPRKIRLALVPRSGAGVVRMTEIGIKDSNPRVSPDGRRILFQDRDPGETSEADMPSVRLFVYDLVAKARTRLANVPPNAAIVGYCWAPDGTRLAYTWRQSLPGQPRAHYTESRNVARLKAETESFLVIADADGANPRTVLSGKAGAVATTIGTVDWR
jgi:Tol biopolymer transport system component